MLLGPTLYSWPNCGLSWTLKIGPIGSLEVIKCSPRASFEGCAEHLLILCGILTTKNWSQIFGLAWTNQVDVFLDSNSRHGLDWTHPLNNEHLYHQSMKNEILFTKKTLRLKSNLITLQCESWSHHFTIGSKNVDKVEPPSGPMSGEIWDIIRRDPCDSKTNWSLSTSYGPSSLNWAIFCTYL